MCLLQPLKSIKRLQQSVQSNAPFPKQFWEIFLNDTETLRLQQACNKGNNLTTKI